MKPGPRIFMAMALFVASVCGCSRKPPKVKVEGPEKVEAGTEAVFKAIVTPDKDGLKFQWKADWRQDRPGEAPCDPVVAKGDAAGVKVLFPKDCGAATFNVTVAATAKGGVVKAGREVEVLPAPEPVWPDPLPASWKVLNDYENPGDPRANNWGGFFGTWGFKGGKCGIQYGEKSPHVLKVSFALPMGDSSCGTFEYLKGGRGKPAPVDIRGFDRIALMMKSGDDKTHYLRLEVVELDPYAATLQGYVGQSELLEVGPAWKRYEVRLDAVLHPMFDRRMGKQVGLKIERKDQKHAGGVVLLDNIAFITKAKEK
ncbi:MAG: hypothetical protein GXP54_10430 [Deltaproteobacteria bacterium]|nr:hypothetical protein [Deltaproteobacteria bacterium]